MKNKESRKDEEEEEEKAAEVKLPQKRSPASDKYRADVKECMQGMKSALAEGLKKINKTE